MEDNPALRVYSDPLAHWFVPEAYKITDTAELIAAAGEQRKTIRVRLEQIDPQAPILRQLKDEGATDYVASPYP